MLSFRQYLKESMKDRVFRAAWEEGEAEYQLGRQLIGFRIREKMSQRQLAKKAHTTQAKICQIERMQAKLNRDEITRN